MIVYSHQTFYNIEMSLILLIGLLFSQTYDNLLQDGIDFGYREQYTEAEAMFNLAISKNPMYPAAYLYKAALLDLYMIDFSTNSREKEFFTMIRKTEEKSDYLSKHSNHRDSVALAYFFKGSAFLYAAVHLGRQHKYLSAVNVGVESIKYLKKSIAFDSTLYDAYLPIGVYYYAVAELPKMLKFVKIFIPVAGSKEQGISMIEIAAKRGRYVKVLARDALSWVLAYDGKRQESIDVAEELVRDYPGTRAFRWTLAYALKRDGRWKDAEKTHRVILYLTLRDQKDDPYDVALALYELAICDYMVGKKQIALYYTDAANMFIQSCPGTEESKTLSKRIRNFLKMLEKYRKTGRKTPLKVKIPGEYGT